MKKLTFFLFLLVIFSCKEEEINSPIIEYIDSYIVLNQGVNAKSTINSISKDFINNRINIFFDENGNEIGNQLQSAYSYKNLVYLVVSGSNKIEIVDKKKFKTIATISSELLNPRYCLVKNEKLYISNWGMNGDGSTNYLSIYNTNDHSFIKTINLNPTNDPLLGVVEQIYSIGNYLYVLNNGKGNGTKLTIVNLTTESIETSITLSEAPNSATILGQDLYLLCSGKTDLDGIILNEAEIWKISETTVKNILDFDDLSGGQTAKFISSQNNNLYFVLNQEGDEGIYQIPVDGGISDLTKIIDFDSPSLYNYNIEALHNFTILKDQIILLESKKSDVGTRNGSVYFYTLNGTFITSFLVGITPNFIFYNE